MSMGAAGDQTMIACLEEALALLDDVPTWQRWQWNPQAAVFTPASAFRWGSLRQTYSLSQFNRAIAFDRKKRKDYTFRR